MATSPSFDSRVASVVPRLNEIVEHIQSDPNPKIVELRDEAMGLMRDAGLISERRVRADVVGVHPSNRYGDGVVPAHVHRLLERIFAKGWSMRELDKPYAVEAAPLGHRMQKAHAAANHRMVTASQGLLPVYEMEGNRIQIFSATCGHTNQGLRCLLHGAPSTHEVIAENGLLNKGYLREKAPAYFDAVEHGIVWEVIPWQVEEQVNGIMTLFQELCEPFKNSAGASGMHGRCAAKFLKARGTHRKQGTLNRCWPRARRAWS